MRNKWLGCFVALLVFGSMGSVLAEPASVRFSSNISMLPGESKNISIIVDPKGNQIAGMQANFIFNPFMIKVNGFTTGNLFSQGGLYRTFPNEGRLDSSTGNWINTFEAIMGRHNVVSIGTYGVLNITAIGSIGQTDILFDHVIIANPDGIAVDFTLTNIGITIVSPPTPTPTPTPTGTPALTCGIDIDEDGRMEYPDINYDNLIDQTDLDYVQAAIDAHMTCTGGNCGIDIDQDGRLEYPDINFDNLIDQTDLDYTQAAIDAHMTC